MPSAVQARGSAGLYETVTTARAHNLDWLPPGKSCAVCFSIDDIHPATSRDSYEAGGDMGEGALGHLEWLMARHAALRPTLFVTADWREISPLPTRKLLAAIPVLRDRVYLAPRWPKGTMSLERHPRFVSYLNGLANVEIAFHGLHHVNTGLRIPVEFQREDARGCGRKIAEMLRIFQTAGLRHVKGICPPGWDAPPALLAALAQASFRYVASARDIRTPVSRDALSAMSGLCGLPLFYPVKLPQTSLVHIPTNFQATSSIERAIEILEMGGLLSIKAHIVSEAFGYVAADGLGKSYATFLNELLNRISAAFGERLWWASMGEIAAQLDRPRP